MKIIRVDQDNITSDEEVSFAYECEHRYLEFVKISNNEVIITSENADADGEYVVQVDDIPNLVKALQAAYDYINK